MALEGDLLFRPLGKRAWKHLSCHLLLALSNNKWEVKESIPHSMGYGGQVRALNLNWTQELHLVPEHKRVWLEACNDVCRLSLKVNLHANLAPQIWARPLVIRVNRRQARFGRYKSPPPPPSPSEGPFLTLGQRCRNRLPRRFHL
jgi:hypothetical protein